MTLQVKETGTTVDFANSREIDLQMYTFQNDVFGLYAYQSVPVTVDATTRNNFANGNLADLQNQANGQGMPIQYIRISWNETQQGSNFYITDLVVGVVSRVTRDFNTGPAYLLDALKAIWWFNQLISKVSMPWKAWLLLQPPNRTESFSRWNWDAVSATWYRSARIGQPIPDPPATSEVISRFISDGQVSVALGKFVQEIVDNGFQCTVLSYNVQVCYQRSPEIRQPGGYVHGYEYKTHTRLSVDFQTTSEALVPFFTPIVIIAIAKAIALIIAATAIGAAIYFALQNLTTTEKSYEKWDWVRNPDTGGWEWKPVETGSEKGPPDWWGSVITIVGVVGVIAVAVLVIPRLIPPRKPKD